MAIFRWRVERIISALCYIKALNLAVTAGTCLAEEAVHGHQAVVSLTHVRKQKMWSLSKKILRMSLYRHIIVILILSEAA